MGKNKKRKSASKHLEGMIMMQKMKKKQQVQKEEDNDKEECDEQDDKDTIFITSDTTAAAAAAETPSSPSSSNSSVEISQRDLQIAIQTLQRIPPHLVQSSTACRDLRRALHPHVLQQMKSYDSIDYRLKVTTALTQRQWPVALQALQGCRDFQQIPKQGTLQRWVRDCNDSPAIWKLKLLTAILTVGKSDDISSGGGGGDGQNQHDPGQALASAAASTSEDELVVFEPWCIPSDKEKEETQPPSAVSKVSNSESNTSLPEFPILDHQRLIIYQEEASERKPPNMFDLLLHYTPQPVIQLLGDGDDDDDKKSPTNSSLLIQKHKVDFLRQADGVTSPFVLENVLTPDECTQFMAAATTLGYRPDHPTQLEHPTGIDSCEWLMESTILSKILNRVRDHLPQTITYNRHPFALHSINARWRFFRYAQNCVYRPHIDGSWPASFVKTDEDGQYTYTTESSSDGGGGGDTSSSTTTRTETRSFMTFLMYLNDDFTGGQTRFYLPDAAAGNMTARGVCPKQGSVLVFPQGNTASLIHEGSAVTQGTKYVVRSDVIYVQQEDCDKKK
jgi:hypothetical protein